MVGTVGKDARKASLLLHWLLRKAGLSVLSDSKAIGGLAIDANNLFFMLGVEVYVRLTNGGDSTYLFCGLSLRIVFSLLLFLLRIVLLAPNS